MIGAGFCVQRVGPALGQPQALGGEASLGPEEAGVFIQQVTLIMSLKQRSTPRFVMEMRKPLLGPFSWFKAPSSSFTFKTLCNPPLVPRSTSNPSRSSRDLSQASQPETGESFVTSDW